MTTDATKLAQAWADKVLTEIPKLSDQGVTDFIVDRREQIAFCARHAPDSIAKVRAALRVRDREIRDERTRQGVG